MGEFETLVSEISRAIDMCERIGSHTHAMAQACENLHDALFWVTMEARREREVMVG